MKTLRTLAAFLCLAGAPLGAATFSMPFVDVAPNQVSQNALVAVWSTTDAYVTPSTAVDIIFPHSITVPASLDPAGCTCISMRNTKDAAGTWASTEVTFTAGSFDASTDPHRVTLEFPAALYPGKFYIRFDSSAGLMTGGSSGQATLALSDPEGNTTVSRAFYLKLTYNAAVSLGTVSGTVTDTNGRALPGALVLASTYGSYLPISAAARLNWVAPLPATCSAYTVATAGDGSYSLSVPPGSYTVKAEVWEHNDGVAASSESSESSISVVSGGTVSQSFQLAPLP